MVWYNRILFNSIKEYTPHWMKTIPYNQTTKTRLNVIGQQTHAYSKNAASFLRFVGHHFTKNKVGFQFLIFGFTFAFTAGLWTPWLFVYQSNNKHRSLDAAIEIERLYKKKVADQEAAEEAAAE